MDRSIRFLEAVFVNASVLILMGRKGRGKRNPYAKDFAGTMEVIEREFLLWIEEARVQRT